MDQERARCRSENRHAQSARDRWRCARHRGLSVHAQMIGPRSALTCLALCGLIAADLSVRRIDRHGTRVGGLIRPRPYLNMPPAAGGPIPRLVSQTGVFRDTRTLTVDDALLPYDIIASFWS